MNILLEEFNTIFSDMNPWWNQELVPEHLTGILRDKYLDDLQDKLSIPDVIIITGMRRCGKTTIMYQLIQKLIDDGTYPKHIFYIQFDHPILKNIDVTKLLNLYREHFGISKKSKIFVFFDEVHYLDNWAQWIKILHDQGNSKIFISGSSKAILVPESLTHLTGRAMNINIWPLTFNEFIHFRNKEPAPGDEHQYVSLAEVYLATGGFPRVVLEEKKELKHQLLREYFDSIIFKDIAIVHQIRDLRSLRELAVFIIATSGKPTSLNKLKNTFKLSLDTIREYISYLEESHLVEGLPISSRSMNERIYNPKKYYALDVGLRTELSGTVEIGPRVETVVYLHLKQLAVSLGYWKDIQEVDFILNTEPPIALECKYRSELGKKDLKSLKKWLGNIENGKAFIITKNLKRTIELPEGFVEAIPLWRFLLEPDVVLKK